MSNSRPRPRPYSKHVDYWRFCLALGISMLSLGVALMLVGTLTDVRPTGILGGIYLIFAIVLFAACGIMYGITNTQRPISGRVIDRHVSVSSFIADDLPLGATLDDLLAGRLAEFQELQVIYWLRVAPPGKNEPNRWFRVTLEVFAVHPAGADYDAKNPATLTTSSESEPASERAPADK